MGNTTTTNTRPNLIFGILGGFDAAILMALLWALITVATKYQIGYMAIAVGAVVGFSVRYFGNGKTPLFRILSAGFALFGCLLGNYLSQLGFYLAESGSELLDLILSIQLKSIPAIMSESFQAMDVLFYLFAIWQAWKFSVPTAIANTPATEESYAGEQPSPYPISKILFALAPLALLAVLSIWVNMNSTRILSDVYETGRKKYEGTTSWNAPHGTWTYWYESGAIKATVSFRKGWQDGPSVEFHENGQKMSELDWKAGLRHGTLSTWFDSGALESEGTFEWDRKQGIWNEYHPNGKLARTGLMKNDLQHGPWDEYDTEGNKTGLFTYTEGTLNGEQKSWDKNGTLLIHREYLDGKERILFQKDNETITVTDGNGTFMDRDESGKIRATGRVIAGWKSGLWETFHEDGTLNAKYIYEGGNEHVLEYWNDNGKNTVSKGNGELAIRINDTLLYRAPYVDGLLEGTVEVFHEEGQLAVTTEYSKGKRSGPYNSFNLDGTLIVEGTFVNDEQDGLWNWYTEDKTLEASATYVEGRKQGLNRFWQYGEPLKTESWDQGELTDTKVHH